MHLAQHKHNFDFVKNQLSSVDHSWIELSFSAFINNVSQIRRLLRVSDKLAFIAKANAYGHGLLPMGLMAQAAEGIDYIAVFFLSEAMELRKQGIKKQILVLGYIDSDPAYALGLDIDFMVDTIVTIDQLSYAAQQQKTICHLHIKINTGLSRFGIDPDEINLFIAYIQKNPFLAVVGVFTHLAEANNEDTTFTHQQLLCFNNTVDRMRAMNIDIPLIHATNTAGLMYFNNHVPTLFRVGLGLYGFFPAPHIQIFLQNKYPDFKLLPVMTWKSKIIAIKKINRGTSVGYDRTHLVERDTVCAMLPIGYSDGYDFPLSSHKTPVLIHDKPAYVLGKIAMNITVIDITDIPHAAIGDEVTLFGSTHEAIHADAIALHKNLKNVRPLLTHVASHITRFIVR